MKAFYRPDRWARAALNQVQGRLWSRKLEREYPIEVLQMSAGKLPMAIVRTDKEIVMAVPSHCVFFVARENVGKKGELAQPITGFLGAFAFLSNFFPVPVMLDRKSYPTVEHAFQAAKTVREEEREAIRLASTPGRAKRLGRKVALRPDWDQVKVDVMLDLLRQKFSDPPLRQKLLATGDAPLIEGNTWGDRFWGCVLEEGKWVGENTLGCLLMQVRAEARASKQSPIF